MIVILGPVASTAALSLIRRQGSGGRHRQKHQQLFQDVPLAELPVQLHHLHQPHARQDRGPLPRDRQNRLLQVQRPADTIQTLQSRVLSLCR